MTGASGFIGRHLVSSLAARGIDVYGLDRRPWPEAPCPLDEIDIRDRGAVLEGLQHRRPAVVVHLAACVGVRPSLDEPGLYADTNVAGTRNVVDAAVACRARHVVFSSSSSIYGATTAAPSHEDDPLQPRSPYATSKIEAESVVRGFAGTHTILRLFTVYGPAMRPDLALCSFARRIARGEPLPLLGDGTSRRDYTHVEDVVAALTAAVRRDDTAPLTCNVGTGRSTALTDVVDMLADCLGSEAHVEHLAPHPADALHTCADVRRAAARLGYAPRIALPDGLRAVAPLLVG